MGRSLGLLWPELGDGVTPERLEVFVERFMPDLLATVIYTVGLLERPWGTRPFRMMTWVPYSYSRRSFSRTRSGCATG